MASRCRSAQHTAAPGSTDGTAITLYGATFAGLSWPGRYSHSPGEVLDLRDVQALSRLIAVLALER